MSGNQPDERVRDPLTRIYGYEEWAGWWHFPVVLGIATTAVLIAAVLI